MIVYKLVQEYEGKLWSYNPGHGIMLEFQRKGWALIYQPNVKTTPKVDGSKLWAFDSLANAQDWDRDSTRTSAGQIWRCKATGVEPCPEFVPVNEQDFAEFWKNRRRGGNFETPAGSLLCDSLTLLERVR